jgi:hypothetical protein
MNEEVFSNIRNRISEISADILKNVSAYVVKQLEQKYYQVSKPINKETGVIIDIVDGSEIAKNIKVYNENNRVVVYIESGTDADKAARVHELFGTAPMQNVRNNIKNPGSVNKILSDNGIKGAKAK